MLFEPIVYILCFLTSLVAMWLLLRGYWRNGSRLLLWSAIAFIAFAVNNLLLFMDIVLLPNLDLRGIRAITALIGVAILLYAFIWEIE
ncbi:MAG TPA: DUF5985 family protein [Stellaceae bacterium]|jgi:heme/copper-type cytochrome/quinol oxidase subunit 4